jgi:hypothetical protein
VPFRASFDCLWCGRASTGREDDLGGWAQLCSDCLGRAGDNAFLRTRLRAALAERAGAEAVRGPGDAAARATDLEADTRAYYAARAPEYDEPCSPASG